MTSRPISRRTLLRGGASATAGLGAIGYAAGPASATTGHPSLTRITSTLQLVDETRRQRFLLTDRKPPVYLNGKPYPAEQRSGPDRASYMIFNDEQQSEKGGIVASTGGGHLSFDYPNVQGLSLDTVNVGALGAARLLMSQMPDPSIPPEELTPEDVPTRVLLGCSNAGDGSLLYLFDSAGRPRITLTVDGNDVPTIQILDADGNVTAQLPSDPSPAASAPAARRRLSELLGARRRR